MSDFLNYYRKYNVKHENTIKSLCEPLCTHLNIYSFSYYSIDKIGNFTYISNTIEFNEYYFSNQLFLTNPYYSHPNFFISGSAIIPCSTDENSQRMLKNKFKADHILLTLEKSEIGLEGFIFGSLAFDKAQCSSYISIIPALKKFQKYFKEEAKIIIGKMNSEKFNIKEACHNTFSYVDPDIPLSNTNPKIQSFLKKISKLSQQEQRCLDLFQKGHSAQATAAVMGISKRTVEYYFENIKNKLNCHSKWELLNY